MPKKAKNKRAASNGSSIVSSRAKTEMTDDGWSTSSGKSTYQPTDGQKTKNGNPIHAKLEPTDGQKMNSSNPAERSRGGQKTNSSKPADRSKSIERPKSAYGGTDRTLRRSRSNSVASRREGQAHQSLDLGLAGRKSRSNSVASRYTSRNLEDEDRPKVTLDSPERIRHLIKRQVLVLLEPDKDLVEGTFKEIETQSPFFYLILENAMLNKESLPSFRVNWEDVHSIREKPRTELKSRNPTPAPSIHGKTSEDLFDEDTKSHRSRSLLEDKPYLQAKEDALKQTCNCLGGCEDSEECICCDCVTLAPNRRCGCCDCLADKGSDKRCDCCFCRLKQAQQKNAQLGRCKNAHISEDSASEPSSPDSQEDVEPASSTQINIWDTTSMRSFRDLLQVNQMEIEAEEIERFKQMEASGHHNKANDSVELTLELHVKAKDFIKQFKRRLMKECQIAMTDSRAPDIRSIIIQAADATMMSPDVDKIQTWKFPEKYNFLDESELAAIFRLVLTRGSKLKTPASQHGFTDILLFEPAKIKWINSAQKLVQKELCETLISGKEADYVARLQQAAKENGIMFSNARIKLTFTKLPKNISDPQFWEEQWTKLASDPISRVPLAWDRPAKLAHPELKSFPKSGFLIQDHQEELETVKSKQIHIPYNEDGSFDRFYLEMLHKDNALKIAGFTEWMNKTGVSRQACEQNVKICYSKKITDRTAESLEYWQQKYNLACKTKIQSFEQWFDSEGCQLRMERAKLKPPSPEQVRSAKNHIVDSMAVDSIPSESLLDDPNCSPPNALDKLSKMHQEAAEFMDSLNTRNREIVYNTFRLWKQSYPRESFKAMALRAHAPLLAAYLEDNDKEAENHISFLQLPSPPESEQDWSNLFAAQCIQVPTQNNLPREEELALRANFTNIVKSKALDSITPEDFKEFGRLRHVYIGRQPMVPPEVYKILRIPTNDNLTAVYVLWRRLYIARCEAAKGYTFEFPVKEWDKYPWIALLCDSRVTKTFNWDDIDGLQFWWAHKDTSYQKLQTESFANLYNNFVRPLERLFALDMPLNEKLQSALHSRDATEDLSTFLLKLIGWEEWPLALSQKTVIEELSKIRATPVAMFSRADMMAQPIKMHKKVDCYPTNTNSYKSQSVREDLRRRGININKIFRIETKFELDEKAKDLGESLIEAIATVEAGHEQLRALVIKKGYTLDFSLRQDLEKAEIKAKKTLDSKKEELFKLWKEFQRVLEKRAAQRYACKPVTTEDVVGLENMKNSELIDKYLFCRNAQKDLIDMLRYPKFKLSEQVHRKIEQLQDFHIKERMELIDKIRDYELKIRDIIHTMDVIHVILDSRAVAIERYEKDWKVLKRLKRMAQEMSSASEPSSTRCPSPPRKRSPRDRSRSRTPMPNWWEEDEKPRTYLRHGESIKALKYLGKPKTSEETSDKAYRPVGWSERTKEAKDFDKQVKSSTRTAAPDWSDDEDMEQNWTQKKLSAAKEKPQEDSWTTVEPPKRSWMPKGSWAEKNRHNRFPDKIQLWDGRDPAPEWAKDDGSIKEIHLIDPFVDITDLKNTIDKMFYKALPINTYWAHMRVELEAQLRHDGSPYQLVITERKSHKKELLGGQGEPMVRKVEIPFRQLAVIQSTVDLVDDLKLRPRAEESVATDYFSLTHPKKQDVAVTISVGLLQHGKSLERMVTITTTHCPKRWQEHVESIQIPWMHWPRFLWYFNKIKLEMEARDNDCRKSKDKLNRLREERHNEWEMEHGSRPFTYKPKHVKADVHQ